MNHLYGVDGAYVGYIDDRGTWIYTTSGEPLGFIHRGSLYTPSGNLLGYIRERWIADRRGLPAVFFKSNDEVPERVSPDSGAKLFEPSRAAVGSDELD